MERQRARAEPRRHRLFSEQVGRHEARGTRGPGQAPLPRRGPRGRRRRAPRPRVRPGARAAPRGDPMKTSTFALLVAIVLLAAGLLGLVPGMLSSPPPDAPPTTFTLFYGYLLRLFPANLTLS